MIKSPECQIAFAPSQRLQMSGIDKDQLHDYLRLWWTACGDMADDAVACNASADLPWAIEMLAKPPAHHGFGSGTQSRLTLAAGMFHVFGLPLPEAKILATIMQRGQRSAVGTHGFIQGGFLVDRGVDRSGQLSQLDVRFEIPSQWRFVLFLPKASFLPKSAAGMHGQLENKAFAQLSLNQPSGMPNRQQMIDLCCKHIAPAIASGDYEAFAPPLYEFNRLSGQYFSQYQFGCYHSDVCAKIVDDVRNQGVAAVGQSSWGPCIFAILPHSNDADTLLKRLRHHHPSFYSASNIDILVTEPDNQGVRLISQQSAPAGTQT